MQRTHDTQPLIYTQIIVREDAITGVERRQTCNECKPRRGIPSLDTIHHHGMSSPISDIGLLTAFHADSRVLHSSNSLSLLTVAFFINVIRYWTFFFVFVFWFFCV